MDTGVVGIGQQPLCIISFYSTLKILSFIVLCWKGWKTEVRKQKHVLKDKYRSTESHRQLEKVSCYGNKIRDKPGL